MTRIESEKQYKAAMARIEELLPLVTEDTPEDDIHSVELVLLSNLVADYDNEHYPIGAPSRTGNLHQPFNRCKHSTRSLLTSKQTSSEVK